MGDIRVPMAPILAALGVPATVTRPAPDNTPIETSGVWVLPTMELAPAGTQFSRRELQRVMALDRSVVPTVPRGTVVQAPEREGEAVQTWRVDGVELSDADHHRVLLVPDAP